MKNRVFLGISGGVDSAVSALLLKNEGYEVLGVTFVLFEKDELDKSIYDAKKVCEKLDIEHMIVDLKEEFKAKVIDYFVSEYSHGRTPNPCFFCNEEIKFKNLLKLSKDEDKIATGHYARLVKVNDRFSVASPLDTKKDQSYFLAGLRQESLSKLVLPLSEYDKSEVREIAQKNDLEVYSKKDSQEICFVANDDYKDFLKQYINEEAGKFLDLDGKVLGKHKGISNYTIGQRKGLGMSFGKQMFVNKIDFENNAIYLSVDDDLFSDEMTVRITNFMGISEIKGSLQLQAKVRYAHKASNCTVSMILDGSLFCRFEEKIRAITKGQIAVFYQDGCIAFSGIIEYSNSI